MSTLRDAESTLHVGNGELSNPLPKAKATAKFSTLCRLDAAHWATGQLPIQCSLNTFVLGRSLGCLDQHPTCFSLRFNSAECLLINGNICAARIILLARDTDLCQTALPPAFLCLLQLQQGKEGRFEHTKVRKGRD